MLLDLLGLYRDVLVIQLDAVVPLINEEMRPQIQQLAANSTANDTGRRLGAIDYARAQIQSGVTPLIGLESLMVEIKDPHLLSRGIGRNTRADKASGYGTKYVGAAVVSSGARDQHFADLVRVPQQPRSCAPHCQIPSSANAGGPGVVL